MLSHLGAMRVMQSIRTDIDMVVVHLVALELEQLSSIARGELVACIDIATLILEEINDYTESVPKIARPSNRPEEEDPMGAVHIQ